MQVFKGDRSASICRVTLSLCIDVAISYPFLTIYGSFLPSDRCVYCKSLINEVYWYRNCVVSCPAKVFNIHIFVTSFPYNVFLVLTQAFAKDKPSTILFYFHQSLVHNMFRLAPWSHGILISTEWQIIYHKIRQLWWQLSLSLTKFIVVTHKRMGKG